MKDLLSNATASLEAVAGNHSIYSARRTEYDTGRKIPFRVAPMPYELSSMQRTDVRQLGESVADYFQTIDELYRTDGTVHALLNTGKPEIFLAQNPLHYLFLRPDLVVTKDGFSLCEIETSPFGLGLSEMLNRAYRRGGYDTLVEDNTLAKYIHDHTPNKGTIVYSNKTKQYSGQLTFLSNEVFSTDQDRQWTTQHIAGLQNGAVADSHAIYRGTYLGEYVTDPRVRELYERVQGDVTFIPSLTPHMEEKAVLALLWDKRFEHHIRKQVGDANFAFLRQIVPPTWIVGQEQYFINGLPNGIEDSVDLATLSQSKRTLVLKESGFGSKSSWSEGVVFLHENSRAKAADILQRAKEQISSLFVVQQFNKAVDMTMQYEDEIGEIQTTNKARLRITPYYALQGRYRNELLSIKVTGCENTDLIHGSSTSINAAVS